MCHDLPCRYALTCYLHGIKRGLGISTCASLLCSPIVLRCGSSSRVACLSSRVRQRRAVLATVFEILEFRLLVAMLRDIRRSDHLSSKAQMISRCTGLPPEQHRSSSSKSDLRTWVSDGSTSTFFQYTRGSRKTRLTSQSWAGWADTAGAVVAILISQW